MYSEVMGCAHCTLCPTTNVFLLFCVCVCVHPVVSSRVPCYQHPDGVLGLMVCHVMVCHVIVFSHVSWCFAFPVHEGNVGRKVFGFQVGVWQSFRWVG